MINNNNYYGLIVLRVVLFSLSADSSDTPQRVKENKSYYIYTTVRIYKTITIADLVHNNNIIPCCYGVSN